MFELHTTLSNDKVQIVYYASTCYDSCQRCMVSCELINWKCKPSSCLTTWVKECSTYTLLNKTYYLPLIPWYLCKHKLSENSVPYGNITWMNEYFDMTLTF